MKRCLLASLPLLVCMALYGQTERNVADRKADTSFTDKVIYWYHSHLNYGTVALLMAVESSFIPFPSEVIVPPAAYQACNPDNEDLYRTDSKALNVLLVILFATLGALLGALLNYFLALVLGRPVVYWFADSKVGHLLMLNSAKIRKAEDYFIENGRSSTLVGRLVPAIRQLISIPAGLSRMNIGVFTLFTAIGATLWNTILAFLGYLAHGQQDLIEKYNGELKILLWGIGVLFVCYLIYKGVKSSRASKTESPDPSTEP